MCHYVFKDVSRSFESIKNLHRCDLKIYIFTILGERLDCIVSICERFNFYRSFVSLSVPSCCGTVQEDGQNG